jgi:hypothetical protein
MDKVIFYSNLICYLRLAKKSFVFVSLGCVGTLHKLNKKKKTLRIQKEIIKWNFLISFSNNPSNKKFKCVVFLLPHNICVCMCFENKSSKELKSRKNLL